MMIVDVVHDAESEYVVYFLLSAYIEAVQFGLKLPDCVTNLPISGLTDVEARFQQLALEFGRASEQPQDHSRVEIEEALRVFDAALCRLTFLERENAS